jgi:CDP-6-deoxy-D-xylo-4-hexulose-3-dehydrase
MQAAIGCAQMDKLKGFIETRRKNYEYLYENLKEYYEYLILPEPERNSEPSWFGFPIMIKASAPFKRNDIVGFLENRKIATRMLFGGNLLKQPAYADIKCRKTSDLVNTDLVMNNLFWIGVYPGIDRQRLKYIIQTFGEFFRKMI